MLHFVTCALIRHAGAETESLMPSATTQPVELTQDLGLYIFDGLVNNRTTSLGNSLLNTIISERRARAICIACLRADLADFNQLFLTAAASLGLATKLCVGSVGVECFPGVGNSCPH